MSAFYHGDSYPIILIPTKLETALTASPPQPQRPVAPIIPPVPTKVSSFNFGLIVLLFALLLTSVTGVGVVGVVLGLILTVSQHFSIQRAKRTYSQLIKAYSIAVEEQIRYPFAVLEYDKRIAEYNKPDFAHNFRRQEVSKAIAATKKASYRSAFQQMTVQIGSSEFSFAQHLVKWFGAGAIHSTMCLPIEYRSFENNYYFPDFVYHDNSGIYIDIEIDEPYAAATKEPIHYHGQDTSRNNYFLSNNWLVVRFAEEQVVKYPEQCCKVIDDLLVQLGIKNYAAYSLHGKIPLVATWSRQQAVVMAAKNYRNHYKAH